MAALPHTGTQFKYAVLLFLLLFFQVTMIHAGQQRVTVQPQAPVVGAGDDLLVTADSNAMKHMPSRRLVPKAMNPLYDDVPATHWAYAWIQEMGASGITSGCAPQLYCPDDSTTRAEMAVFLERGIHGSDFVPPAATGTLFSDVPLTHWAAAWIEQLANDGVTNGCGGGNYCPDAEVDRAQMAVFLLKAKYGASYVPPAATGTLFADVPLTHWAAAWIEQLANDGVTSGCGGGNYCPQDILSRAQMAVFIVRTFGLSSLAMPLNDTGITWGGDYPSGNNTTCTSNIGAPQDCDQGRDATHNDDSDGHAGFSFTKLDANGNPLPASAASWSCVKDNVTGLIWEVKTTDGGLHDKNDSYNWYNTDASNNGGFEGYADDDGNICYGYSSADPASYCNTQAFVARVNQQGWCGYHDWRMPSREELRSPVNYAISYPGPTIDTNYFPNDSASAVWSASPNVYGSSDAWGLDFSYGGDDPYPKGSPHHVRLVRGGQ